LLKFEVQKRDMCPEHIQNCKTLHKDIDASKA